MEALALSNNDKQQNPLSVAVNNNTPATNANSHKPFIEANTIESTLEEMEKRHIIPVFTKDNEQLISQVDFVEVMGNVVQEVFKAERITKPSIRLSHPIKGR